MENTYSIYKFTFSDGKVYIGQTSGPIEDRWKGGEGYKGQDVYVPIILDGWENVQKEILHTSLTSEQADDLEKHYIKKYNSRANGYNRTDGGKFHKEKYITINVNEDKVLSFLKRHIKILKPTTLKLLLYFIFNNNEESFLFSPAKISQKIGISDETSRKALRELIDLKIIIPGEKENEFIFTF